MQKEEKKAPIFNPVLITILLSVMVLVGLAYLRISEVSTLKNSQSVDASTIYKSILPEADYSTALEAINNNDFETARKILAPVSMDNYEDDVEDLYGFVEDNLYFQNTDKQKGQMYRKYWKKYETKSSENPKSELYKMMNNHFREITLAKEKVERAELLEEERANELAQQQRMRAQELKNKTFLNEKSGNFRITQDTLEATNFYRHKTFTPHRNDMGFLIYIGQNTRSGNIWMRLSVQYYAGSWLFVDGYTVYVDGKKYDRSNIDFERDNSSRRVWEWSDTSLTIQDLRLIRAIINSNEAVVRLRGNQYIHDYTISAEGKSALKDTLDYFDALGGKIG